MPTLRIYVKHINMGHPEPIKIVIIIKSPKLLRIHNIFTPIPDASLSFEKRVSRCVVI